MSNYAYSGFTLSGNFQYFTSASTRNKISSWSDVPAVILFDQFSKKLKIAKHKERGRERECVCVCVFHGVCVCMCVCVCV